MATAGPNHEMGEYWEDRAGSWIEAEEVTALVGGPIGDAAVERLGPAVGESVLDVGCGTGPTTLRIAELVGPGGSVTGVDISETMVATAQRRADSAGVDHASFLVADVQTADLGSDRSDAAFSRFGVMFFSDPVAAFANIRLALRPAGRLVFACWQDLLRNEWMFVPGAAAVAASGQVPNMPAPGAPGPFSLCDPAHVRDVLSDAGFEQVSVEDLTSELVVPEDRIADLVDGARRIGAVREQLELFSDDPTMRARIVDAVAEELHGRVHDGALRLGSAAWIVSATG